MSKRTMLWLIAGLVAVGAMGLLAQQLVPEKEGGTDAVRIKVTADSTSVKGLVCGPNCPRCALKGRLGGTLKALDAATEAVKAGKKDQALARLAEARALVSEARGNVPACAKPVATAVPVRLNARCPIMGGKLDWSKVSGKLTRDYKGGKVGFCCAGCPKRWDGLSDEQKDAALAKSK